MPKDISQRKPHTGFKKGKSEDMMNNSDNIMAKEQLHIFQKT